jgi:hypothetical protein
MARHNSEVLSPASLRRRYLDETVRAHGDRRIRILERPGRWMAADALARVVDDVQTIVRAAVPAGALAYGVASGEREPLERCVLTIVYERDGRPIGFSAPSLLDCELRGRPVEVLHLGLVVVDPAVRAHGLTAVLYGLTSVLLFARRQLRPLWISNVTQVPSVFGMVAEHFDDVYPTADADARQSYDHLQLARQVMSRHRHVFGAGTDAELDEERAIIRNAYTGGSDNLKKRFVDAPRHRHDAFNAWCERHLDYERGDDVLQLGRVTLRSFGAFFTRSAGVLSPPRLATRVATRALAAFVAPTLQWFAADRAMADLRPAQALRRRRAP